MANEAAKTLLTEGPIGRRLLAFTIPLFLGNLFQQLYNTVDSLIVGNFLGSNALAAVSSSGSLIFLMVGFFNGIAMGAGVVIARYFGARKKKELQEAVHTTVFFGVLCGIALTVIGVFMAPRILVWMKTPEEVLPQSVLYFRVYFMGSFAFVLYNNLVGILRSVGDSRHPLYYLVFSSVVNILLDLLFVVVFHRGVGSVALATIISQFVSAGLCFYRLMYKSPEEYRVVLKKIRLYPVMLKQIIANGLPAGIQTSVISIANIFVQSNINRFGQMAMAGCGTYSKIEGFAFLPVTCFTLALTTFVSQNLGAKKYERAKKGARFGFLCCSMIAEIIGILIYFTIPVLIAAFNRNPEVIAYGTKQAHIVTLFFFLVSFSHCQAAIMRGSGRPAFPMLIMLICWCLIRVSYITIISKWIPTIDVVLWAYPLTWALSSIIFLINYLKSDWVHNFERKEVTQ